MKYISWLRLLSVLLLTVTLFVGCTPQTGDGTGTEETTAATTEEVLVNDEKKHEPVDAKLENFFQLSKENAWKVLSTVTRLGEQTKSLGKQVVSGGADGNLLILREADVDHMNVVTEVFTVYNVELKKTVLTVQNQYENGFYSTFNWSNLFVTDEKIKYPESEMDVRVEKLSGGDEEIYVIKVAKATVTPIDEEVRKENEYACVYDIKTSYDYYDVAGKLITSTAQTHWETVYNNGDASVTSYRIGDTFVTFDLNTGESVYVSNYDTDQRRAAYDVENEKYGYFLGQGMSGALDSPIPFVEVFSKTSGNCIRRHYIKDAMSATAFVLEDGDVLIQKFSLFDEDETNEKPDFNLMGLSVKADHYILDVETGVEQALELDFVIADLISAGSSRFEELQDWGPTEHVVNAATVVKYDNHTITEGKVLVLDNDGTVMFTFEQMVPEHLIEINPLDLGVSLLDNGEYLVDLQGVVADSAAGRAIVTRDGKVRSYLPSDAEVVGELVVMEDGIYDYDLNRLYSFEEKGYTLEYVIGDRIVASSPYEDEEAGDSIAYYVMNRTDAGNVDPQRVLVDCELLADQSSKDYVMAYNFKTQKYVLYNAELRHLLTTTHPMEVYEFDGNYLVHTTLTVEGKQVDLIYTVE